MKVVFLLVVSIVVCVGEKCQNTQECNQHHTTVCGPESPGHVGCSQGQCTCLDPHHNNRNCTTRDHCVALNNEHHYCARNHEHCVDNICRCEKGHHVQHQQ